MASRAALPTDDMLLDAVDADDNVIGTTRRDLAIPSHANFRVVHVLLINRANEMLLQQISLSRQRHPGAWGSSVAAYVASGETYLQAAERRMPQELGLSVPLTPLVKTSMTDEQSKKFIMIFTGRTEGPFEYDEAHIAHVEFQSIPNILALRDSGARLYTPTFLYVLNKYLDHQT